MIGKAAHENAEAWTIHDNYLSIEALYHERASKLGTTASGQTQVSGFGTLLEL